MSPNRSHAPRSNGRALRFALGLLAWSIGLGWSLLLDDPRLRYPSFLAGQTVAWAGLGLALTTRPSGTRAWGVLALGLAARLLALSHPPAFSEDLFRHVFEGRLSLDAGLLFPYLHPPAEAPQLGLSPHLLDEAWLRINHPELATLYPLGAQTLFAAGAGLGDALGLPADRTIAGLLLAVELSGIALLFRTYRPGALLWALCPLAVLEVAREGHADVLASVGLLVAVLAFAAGRGPGGWRGLAAATLAKLNGLVLVPLALRVNRRGAWILVPLGVVVALPVVASIGSGEASGLGAYATRWRSGDGAYTLVLAGTRWLLGAEWRFVPALGLTVTADQMARAVCGASFLVVLAYLSLRRRRPDLHTDGGLLLVLLLLLSPTLHPWYVLWVLPFVAVGSFPGRAAALWLAVASPLLHHPGYLELLEGRWRELPVLAALVHVPAWGLLFAARPWQSSRDSAMAEAE